MAKPSDPTVALPTSFCIRIGSEEVLLLSGVTLIGRDAASCRITLNDSLISRRHARIHCDGDRATIEDLGSLNGTRVNGVLIRSPHGLREGDRIGIGSNELVVGKVAPNDWDLDAPTGILNICESCKHGYPAVLGACPQCGTKNATTRPGARPQGGSRWNLGMMLELIGKSILMGNPQEVDKLMRQTAVVVSDQMREGRPFDADELRALTEAAGWLAKAQESSQWTDWMARVSSGLQRTLKPTGDVAAPPADHRRSDASR